jgi:hypothetical protein
MKNLSPIKYVWILLITQLLFFLVSIFVGDYSEIIQKATAVVSGLAFCIGALAGLPALIVGIVKKEGEFMACGYLLLLFNTAPAVYLIYLGLALT